jgi:hypothetical protein
MKIAARLAAVLALGVGSSGCFTVDMLVKVKGDGSGTVEKTITMNPQALQEMKSQMESAGFKDTGDSKKKGTKEKSPADLTDKELLDGPFDPEELKKEAAKMGTGVTFVSATPVRQPDKMGVKAVFAFKDINQLKLSQKPLPENGPGGGKASPEDDLKFALVKKGGNSVLTLTSKGLDLKPGTGKPKASPAPAGVDKMAEGMLEMMKPMLKGLRITIGVEVDGTVVKTNSAYVSGNRVTYMDMDFGALLADQKALKEFGQGMEGSVAEQKAALAKIKGMKVHLDPEMVVEFKAN